MLNPPTHSAAAAQGRPVFTRSGLALNMEADSTKNLRTGETGDFMDDNP